MSEQTAASEQGNEPTSAATVEWLCKHAVSMQEACPRCRRTAVPVPSLDDPTVPTVEARARERLGGLVADYGGDEDADALVVVARTLDLLAQRVERLEKAIREALELHVEEDGFCMACTTGWECRTHRILTEGVTP